MVKTAIDAEEVAEEARKADEEKAVKYVVIRAEETPLKAKADTDGAATREAQNSAVKAKEVAAANEVAKRQAAKDKETELQAATIKEEAACQAREAEFA